MTQATIASSTLPPPAIVDALVLQTTQDQHRQVVRALAPAIRGPGQAIFAAIDPSDLIAPMLGVPPVLTADQRMARILRGT